MELLHAYEYVACIQAGKKPKLAMVGPLMVTDGTLTATGKYILMIGGLPYEVKPDFVIYVQWGEKNPYL